MKTSITKLRSSLFLVLAVSTGAWAKDVAQVTALSGQVFCVTVEGKTYPLKQGDRLAEKSEVMVSEGSSVTLNDYYDASFSLIAGSHLKFFDKSVLLKKGKTWIQSHNSRHPLSLTTANGHVDFWKGEFITTFDQASSRSQFLVVNGELEVSNVLEKNMKYTVAAGTFTVVDPEIENGVPRAPTKVGLTSMNNAVAEFKGLSHKPETVSAPARGIASVDEAPAPAAQRGEIIFWNKKRAPASVAPVSAHSYWKKKAAKSEWNTSDAPIKFYGIQNTEPAPKIEEPVRNPASFMPLPSPAAPKKIGSELNVDAEFSNSLRQETAQQPKYSKELENLIQDLKSY